MTGSHVDAILPEPLTVLYEQSGLPRHPLPAPLAHAYGGDLGFPEVCVYGNFVASLDGVVALGAEYPSSGSAISGREPADRFVMGLLRAFADAVLIGAGTLRATPAHHWTPEHVCPGAAADLAALRSALGSGTDPELFVVTASGDLPVEHPALKQGAVIVTTARGARRLDGRLPGGCTLLTAGPASRLDATAILAAIHRRGHTTVLTEGGPRLLGQLIDTGLLDELFLTVAPLLAGRAGPGRPGLISGIELLPLRREPVDLISARRRASYLPRPPRPDGDDERHYDRAVVGAGHFHYSSRANCAALRLPALGSIPTRSVLIRSPSPFAVTLLRLVSGSGPAIQPLTGGELVGPDLLQQQPDRDADEDNHDQQPVDVQHPARRGTAGLTEKQGQGCDQQHAAHVGDRGELEYGARDDARVPEIPRDQLAEHYRCR